MASSDDTKKYIEDLKKKIRKKTKVYCESKTDKNDVHDLSYGLKENNMYDYLDWAEKNAKIGADVPSFSSLSVPRRIIYRWVVKFLFKVLKVITINQRQFNLSVLDTFRCGIEDYNSLKLRFAEAKAQFNNSVMELELRLKQQNIEIGELKKTVDYLKYSLIQMEQRINNIPEVVGKGNKEAGKSNLMDLTGKVSHSLDSFYVFLEDNLRGSREEIKERLQIYLPIIKKANAGLKNSPVLDIGCGRGEWLELLKESGLHSKGLDLNKIMIRICKEQGLNVAEGEALSFLKDISGHSLGAVTCFHLIEHCGFEYLVKLLKEILRVLKPGGLVILETPNPDNILVGSRNFYLDPTHNKPLPSPLIKLILQSCGFSQVEIMYLNPYGDDAKIKKDDFETAKRFNNYFYGPQDYAAIGYKI